MKNKANEILTSPCRCGSKPSISSARRRRREVPAALGEGIRPRELHPPHLKTSRGEYQAQRCKNKLDTNLPLFAAAPYDRYRSGRGGVGSPPQFWEERSAEEQQTREFQVRYDANQTKYLPSPRLSCSV
jgi:hypothetical protein